MEALSIYGGKPLYGEVTVSGAKNAALPILAACLVTESECVLHNCPGLTDVRQAIDILRTLGCRVSRKGGTVTVDARQITGNRIPAELICGMRASVLFQGALYARTGETVLSQPGGCQLGARPINYHLSALEALGAALSETAEGTRCSRREDCGGFYHFPYPSVGATENAILAAVRCRGTSVLRGCAREPEITDLCRFLRQAGAEISGEGTDTILVQGGRALHGTAYRIIPDRMEALTYLCACAGCGGEITLRQTDPAAFRKERELLVQMGCELRSTADSLTICAPEQLRSVPLIVTVPYPGFSTDAQPLFLAALLRAEGVSRFCERVFEDRLSYTEQLRRLGAEVTTVGRYARLTGGRKLHGSSLSGTDLRGTAALLLAALQAEGESSLTGLQHLKRGYNDFPAKLRGLGAQVREMTG